MDGRVLQVSLISGLHLIEPVGRNQLGGIVLWNSVDSSQRLWQTSGGKAVNGWLKLSNDPLLRFFSVGLLESQSLFVPVFYTNKLGFKSITYH